MESKTTSNFGLTRDTTNDIFYPTSGSLNPDIIRTLDSFEISWDRAQLFKTLVSDLSDLRNVYYDILVFFSPTGIKSLFENFPNFSQEDTRLAIFGSTTIKSVEEKGLRVDIYAPNPKAPSMSMALDQYIREANKRRR